MDVVHKIEKTSTDGSDRPVSPIRMNHVVVQES
ncbi:hypothetical protein [Sorangium sp. So ce1000]